MEKKYTQKEALEYCFSRVKQSILGRDDYDRFRQTKRRYEAGKLSDRGKRNILEYFGFEAHTEYVHIKEKDQSQS